MRRFIVGPFNAHGIGERGVVDNQPGIVPARVFEGDRDLVSYAQRMLGYSLTGSIRDHALFFLYGMGTHSLARRAA